MSRALTDSTILCLSHLRWETTLFQRPQQLMSRFAAMGLPVVYASQSSARRFARALLGGRWRELAGRAGPHLLYRNWPFLPGAAGSPAIGRLNDGLLGSAARRVAARFGPRPLLLWLYHPGLLPAAARVPHDLLVYDCMDPFVAFKAQRDKERIAALERALLARADVVFTGGRTLQATREGINPRTYCFPSGVDLDHFAKALDERTSVPEDVARLPRPVLGYWGAVDERLDFGLLAHLCRAFPHGSVVLLGPLVGLERPPVDAPNLHWLGEKEYAALPAYLKAFDVCLLPFAASVLTAATSPTKTPEYLAGGRPMVATPVPDVAAAWGDVAAIAATPEAFADAVGRALERPRPDLSLVAAARRRAMTWEQIAQAMRERIEEAMRDRH